MLILPLGHERGSVTRWPWLTTAIVVGFFAVQFYATARGQTVGEVFDAMAQLDRPMGDVDVDALASELDRLEDAPLVRWGYVAESGQHANRVLSTFVQNGWIALIVIGAFVWLLGAPLEDRWGPLGLAAFYVGAAVVSSLCFDAVYRGADAVAFGAAPVVSALMGAFLVYYGRAPMEFFYWIFLFFYGRLRAPAYVTMLIWSALVLLVGAADPDPDIAMATYASHFGTLAFGAGVALLTGVVSRRRAIAPSSHRAAAPPPSVVDAGATRYARCVAALDARDAATIRTTASRVVLDLASASDRRAVDICLRTVAAGHAVALTDRAWQAAAAVADRFGDVSAFMDIVRAVRKHHPHSTALPPLLWRVSELQRDGGRTDLSVATLEELALQHAASEHGKQARAELLHIEASTARRS